MNAKNAETIILNVGQSGFMTDFRDEIPEFKILANGCHGGWTVELVTLEGRELIIEFRNLPTATEILKAVREQA